MPPGPPPSSTGLALSALNLRRIALSAVEAWHMRGSLLHACGSRSMPCATNAPACPRSAGAGPFTKFCSHGQLTHLWNGAVPTWPHPVAASQLSEPKEGLYLARTPEVPKICTCSRSPQLETVRRDLGGPRGCSKFKYQAICGLLVKFYSERARTFAASAQMASREENEAGK